MPLLALSVYSCDKGDDGDGDNGSGGYTWPKYDKLVKAINWQDEDGNTDNCTFTYDDQQRITRVAWEGEGYFLSFSYEDNLVKINEDNRFYTTHTLDENGYLTRSDDQDGSYALHQYSNGYSSKSTERNPDRYEIVYTWNNGNLVGTSEKYTDENEPSNYGYSLTYNNVPNKLNINILEIFDFSWWDPTYINFKGRTPSNYPITLRENGENQHVYSYTFDSNNYPTKIVETTQGHKGTYTIIYY